MPVPQNYIQSANAYPVVWAAPQRSVLAGSFVTAAGLNQIIFSYDTIVTVRGGPLGAGVLAALSSMDAFGMLLTSWLNLTAAPGASTLTIEVDFGDAVFRALPAFPLIAGLNQCVTPVLGAFRIRGTINTTNIATVVWHCQMSDY